MIRKGKMEEKVRSFALREDDAIWKAIDCQQGEAKRSYHYHCSSFSFVWNSRCFYACFCIVCYCFS